MQSPAFRIGALLVLVIVTLGGADYYFKERPHELAVKEEAAGTPDTIPTIPETAGSSSSMPETMTGTSVNTGVEPNAFMSSSASSPRVVKKGVSTKRKSSVDIPSLLASLQFIVTQSSEASLLQLIAQGTNVQTVVLLLNNDRAALFSWIESDNTKAIFGSLKQALQEQFSPKLTGLIDQTLTGDNGPPVDMLAFTDPAISPEKVIFIRVRDRLYEFHVAEKGTDAISALIAELSK